MCFSHLSVLFPGGGGLPRPVCPIISVPWGSEKKAPLSTRARRSTGIPSEDCTHGGLSKAAEIYSASFPSGMVHPLCDPKNEETLTPASILLSSGMWFHEHNLLRPKGTLIIMLELIELHGFPPSLNTLKLHFHFHWLVLNKRILFKFIQVCIVFQNI